MPTTPSRTPQTASQPSPTPPPPPTSEQMAALREILLGKGPLVSVDALRQPIFGQWLWQKRNGLGLSQRHLAKITGTSAPTIARAEEGGEVKLDTVARLLPWMMGLVE